MVSRDRIADFDVVVIGRRRLRSRNVSGRVRCAGRAGRDCWTCADSHRCCCEGGQAGDPNIENAIVERRLTVNSDGTADGFSLGACQADGVNAHFLRWNVEVRERGGALTGPVVE